MPSIGDAELIAAFEPTGVAFPDGDAPEVPTAWRPVAAAEEADRRIAGAPTLWDTDLLARLPRFAALLRERLADVRLCVVRNRTALAYLARADDGDLAVWIGYPPAGAAVQQVVFPDTLPAAAREFLRATHGGFTAPDGESYGLLEPRVMDTFARWRGVDGPIEGWDDEALVGSTRLMVVAMDGGEVHYCTSPDLPPGSVAVVDGTEVEPRPDFFDELDQLMAGRFAF